MAIDSTVEHCHTCLAPLRYEKSGEPVVCHCGAQATLFIYPAMLRVHSGEAGEAIQAEGESACFLHAGKRAVGACDSCGRFVCALCRIEWGQRVLCPACVSAAEKRTDLLVRSRPLYDSMALAVAGVSLLLLEVSLLTAPFAIWLAIRGLRAPGSLTPRTKVRAWLAIILATVEFVGWTWLMVYLVLKMRMRA